MKRLGRMAAAVVVLLSVALAAAQTDARFAGVVMDPSGAFVANATVTAKNEKTGEERTVTTTEKGRYLIPNLKPSTYTLKVEVKGFAPLEYKGLPLATGQEFPMDLK